MPDDFRAHYRNGITVTTPVSLGLLGGVVVFGFAILGSLWSWGGAITHRLDRHDALLEGVKQAQSDTKQRIGAIETHKETWSYQDMFKWAVHLQRDNPQIKVPEPNSSNTSNSASNNSNDTADGN